jgi:hypothetical protein
VTTDPADELEPAAAAWTLVQTSALLRSADELLLTCLRVLGPEAHAGFPEDAVVALDVDAVEALHALLAELADVGDQLRVLGDCLPAAPLELRYEQLREATVADLASGVADPQRALLAARTLDLADGWPALAEALRAGEAHADWHEITVAQLLRRFRGADAALVRSVLAEAGIGEQAAFADCPPDRLDRLAAALEARGAERR